MLSATLERHPLWRTPGPWLKPDNPETAELFRQHIQDDFLCPEGKIDYTDIFLGDVYDHLARLCSSLGVQIKIDGRVYSSEELYEASL